MCKEGVVAPHLGVLGQAVKDGQYLGGIIRPPKSSFCGSPQPICIVLGHDDLCVATSNVFRNALVRAKNLMSESLIFARAIARAECRSPSAEGDDSLLRKLTKDAKRVQIRHARDIDDHLEARHAIDVGEHEARTMIDGEPA